MIEEQNKKEKKSRFLLLLILEPGEEYLAQLRKWPATPLHPDYLVATSGLIGLHFDGKPVAYADGKFVPLQEGESLPPGAVSLMGDYVGGFAQRLATALGEMQEGKEQYVSFVDNPGGISFQEKGGRVTVSYKEGKGKSFLYTVDLPVKDFRMMTDTALKSFYGDLLSLNPALASHEDVVRLKESLSAL